MIYCIWYPSGGFGHTVNTVVSMYGHGFARPPSDMIQFSDTGDLHSVKTSAPKYVRNPQSYSWHFPDDVKTSVLIDNGINDESEIFRKTFPTATVIKLCYNDRSWPIIAKTMILKALKKNLEQELVPDQNRWSDLNSDWVKREKYFLYLRDHKLRHRWKFSSNCINIDIGCLYNYDSFSDALSTVTQIEPFTKLHDQWKIKNHQYFDPILQAHNILDALKCGRNIDTSGITDVWAQAVINYFIWLDYGLEVPANDFTDWFSNTGEIHGLLHA